jgi:drug/metabolite transporter (DMT)-like permease
MIGELAALGAAISWTVSAMFYAKALQKTRPISANIVRLACTCGLLLLFLVAISRFGILVDLPLNIILLACVSGMLGLGVGDTLYMLSLKNIGVANAVPISCTYPLFNLLWAVFLVGEPVTLPVILGAIAIFSGIWLLSQNGRANKTQMRKKAVTKGVFAALVAAILWSISITMINIALKETPDIDHALAINTFRIMGIAASLLGLSPLIDRNSGFLKMQKRTVALLVAGGVVALGLGWFFLAYSLTETLESKAVPISSTTPLFSTLAATVLMHEKVTPESVLGSAIIVIGIFLIFAI